jgi:hypothetical protein
MIYVVWFPKESKSHIRKFIRKWFGLYKMQYVLLNNTILLITLINIKPNHVLVNINKLKLYKLTTSEVRDYEVYLHQSIGKNHIPHINHKEESIR